MRKLGAAGNQPRGATTPTRRDSHKRWIKLWGQTKSSKTFTPDTLGQAHSEGYDNCAYCLGGSRR